LYKCTTYQTIHSISLEAIFIISQAMPIDLSTLPDLHGELLPDLNKQPTYEQQDKIMSVQQDQLYDDEAHLQNQHGELLPDLNEKTAYEQEDEIAHL
jgi:hypothetical protein